MTTRTIDIEKKLIDHCRVGDRKAQYELYHLYAKMIFNVCVRITGHSGEAEDILQETFLDAFGNINNYRGDSTIGAWLKKIAVNKSINSLRKKKLVLFDELPGGDNIPDDPETDNEKAWEVKQVLTAIKELPDGYRLVLSLYLIEDYTHAEIARLLNISEATSKTQYMRAKNKVREQFAKRYER